MYRSGNILARNISTFFGSAGLGERAPDLQSAGLARVFSLAALELFTQLVDCARIGVKLVPLRL
jgi:hypothetical protein